MYTGNLLFAQVMEFALWHTFRLLVANYRGDFNVRTFSCLDHHDARKTCLPRTTERPVHERKDEPRTIVGGV